MCECNNNVLPVITKSLTAGQLTLTVPDHQFVNYVRYELVGVNFLPAMVGTEQVYVVSNAIAYPLIDKAGNIVRAGRLLNSNRYCLQFGSDGLGGIPHFVVLTCIPTRVVYSPNVVLEPQTRTVQVVKAVTESEEKKDEA